MYVIYLPGNSIRNKEWVEKVKTNFDSFSKGEIVYYDHWEKGEENIYFEKELEKLTKIGKKKDKYVVLAKSVGVILALKAIADKKIKPQKVIFCGFPCSFVAGNNFSVDVGKALLKLSIPTIFVQNEFDKVGGEKEVREVLKKFNPKRYRIVVNPGINTHDYENYPQLTKLAKEFFEK